MACFESDGKNPQLVQRLVDKLPNGHTTIQDRCKFKEDACRQVYRCNDTSRTIVRSYGNCDKQIYPEEVELGKSTLTNELYCALSID